jgi:nicotinate-nucleotide adenylyltransferase
MSGSPLIGIFGGTFDPVHVGHLQIAEQIRDAAGLNAVYFIPAGEPRLRSAPVASARDRSAMVSAAIKSNPGFLLDECEITRRDTSYTIDTLRELKQRLGEHTTLCFIIGADAFQKLAGWRDWEELFRLCHFIIADRPGHHLATPGNRMLSDKILEAACAERWVLAADDLRKAPDGLIFVAPATLTDISSTTIRARIDAGKSIRYLVPDTTLDYINNHQLYTKPGAV